jgi:poly(A) polymerase
MAREILTGLRYSGTVVDDVARLVETHMQLHSYTPEWSDGAVRRLMLRLGAQVGEAIDLARADASGHALDGTSQNAPKFDELERRVRKNGEEQVEQLTSPLTGNDLMRRYNRPPGPWIREIKTALQNAVIDGDIQRDDREAAWRIADERAGKS